MRELKRCRVILLRERRRWGREKAVLGKERLSLVLGREDCRKVLWKASISMVYGKTFLNISVRVTLL